MKIPVHLLRARRIATLLVLVLALLTLPSSASAQRALGMIETLYGPPVAVSVTDSGQRVVLTQRLGQRGTVTSFDMLADDAVKLARVIERAPAVARDLDTRLLMLNQEVLGWRSRLPLVIIVNHASKEPEYTIRSRKQESVPGREVPDIDLRFSAEAWAELGRLLIEAASKPPLPRGSSPD